MEELEKIVYQRMIRDTGTGGLVSLLGNVSRINHGHQVAVPSAPGLTFSVLSDIKGRVPRQTREIFVTFNIFAQNYTAIADRIFRLFDNQQHPMSLISGGAFSVEGVSSVFDFEGPDGFDESLETQTKDLRFRFFVVTKARAPI